MQSSGSEDSTRDAHQRERIFRFTSPRKCASPTRWLPLRIFSNSESEGQTIQQWGRADRIHFFPPQVITPDKSPKRHLKTVWINNDLVFLHPGTKTKQIRGYFTCGYGSDNSLYEKERMIPFSSAFSPFPSPFLEWPGPLQHREGRQPSNNSPAQSCRGARFLSSSHGNSEFRVFVYFRPRPQPRGPRFKTGFCSYQSRWVSRLKPINWRC